ncbi:hypothetical protein ACFQGW_23355 [Xanthomonas theicola]|uniref:hypothetical protein n=1 Tax=Xanthomonas theicola TaxID=56464 RepID=UPI0036245564
MSKGKRVLRYRDASEMPEGMRKLVAAAAPARVPQHGRTPRARWRRAPRPAPQPPAWSPAVGRATSPTR